MRRIRSGSLGCALLAGLVLLAAGKASAEDSLSLPNSGSTNYNGPLVSAEVLKGFMNALQRTPEYQWTSALRPDRVQPLLEQWQRDMAVQLRPQTIEAWAWWVRDLSPLRVESDVPQEIQLDSLRYYKQTVPYLVIVNDPNSRVMPPQFRVPPNVLGEFRAKFVWGIDIVDPANMVVERFTARNQDLTSVVGDLCEKGKLGYSFRQDAGDKIRISLDIRNRSVVECLNAAAAAAGWKVSYSPGAGRGVRDNRVFVPDLLKAAIDAREQAGHAADTQAAQPVPDALTALGLAVKEAAEETLKVRPVVILLPDTGAKQ
jgi:hypothetical protein